ncbi:MAG: ABC transporter substrate-binding protein [Spirochaetales bacterium]|nr:ABC transporter substrate-binding protein [Spirochaetales bacterium]MCF7937275.1 ABC transporter substrate-binding protein [Spirochaetales bacterium]
MGKQQNRQYFFLIIALVLIAPLVLGFLGCGRESDPQTHSAGTKSGKQPVLRIAEQYGLAYAPLSVAKARGLVQAELPGWRIEWKQLGNTAAIREAMIAKDLDTGFMGIPPFLIGWDRGMKWKIFTGLSQAPLGLVTWRSDIRSLEDFDRDDRIALPQPGSIQHILLSMAAERSLGAPKAFDSRLVTLNHPNGMQALLARRDITAHFTSPPYLMMELATEDMHEVISGQEAMGGEFTFIVGTVTDEFADRNPEAVKGLERALDRAMTILAAGGGRKELAAGFNLELPEIESYLDHPDLVYTTEVQGLAEFLDFMLRHNFIRRKPEEKEGVSGLLWAGATK